jgi:hypothetical protein
MEIKKCSACGEVKSVNEFHKNKKKKDGYHNTCKVCRKKEYKKYYQENKDKILKRSVDFYNKELKKEYYENNKNEILTKMKSYYQDKRVELISYKKDHYKKNKDRISNKAKKYYQENKDNIKKYHQDRKPLRNECKRYRYKNDTLFNLKETIKSRINSSFINRGYTKKSRTHTILGCSYEQLKQHLEIQFEDWMTWDNKGNPEDGILEPNKTWDIDHIIPLSSCKTEDDVIKLNHYTNLQPLCSYTNRYIKKDNY